MAKPKSSTELRRIIKRRDIPTVTGLSIDRIEQLARIGLFPKRVKLAPGGHASGWFEDEVREWQQQRAAERNSGWPRAEEVHG